MIDGLISASEIKEIANRVYAQYPYDYIGIRVQEGTHGANIGQVINHRSSVWVEGDETSDQLDGVCAVSAKEAMRYQLSFGYYSGDTVLILGSNSCEYGEDDGEIIMRNAVVLDIISK